MERTFRHQADSDADHSSHHNRTVPAPEHSDHPLPHQNRPLTAQPRRRIIIHMSRRSVRNA